MSVEPQDTKPPLDHTRQVTIDALCEHFANDAMGVEEFERRVDAAHSASSSDELKELLRDLPGGDLPATRGPGSVPTSAGEFHVTLDARQRERGWVVAMLGGTSRKGTWTPARKNYAVAVLGGAELDFREALMEPGVTELDVYAVWGGVEIIVPPGLNVESHGMALLGGFEHAGDSRVVGAREPTLRVRGLAIMGGVEITVRHVGESARDARKRRRSERRERRRLGRGRG